ncbi:hypothetical protein AK88_04597 [Plasmodium fragile]|uniref:Uncharacterized protein n=1 Tax=Plasmodium fragile TaxID=5857 RepID=A0A0D9QJ79_PLAFR|nr:uncharacterized protein AK88_04597 [Plasmodium fragile]KJP85781.1 hypothetical protein AK88_04597 [Plasmodium fragile]
MRWKQNKLYTNDLPGSQLNTEPYKNNPLRTKMCMPVLATVIDQCEVAASLQEKKVYVDNLLHNI